MKTLEGIRKARTLIITLSLVLMFSAMVPLSGAYATPASSFSENENLTATQISERFAHINSSYDLGEEFSASDADFVLTYGTSYDNPRQTRATGNISSTGSAYGTTVNVYGRLWHNGTFSYNWGGEVNAVKVVGNTPRQLTAYVSCTSYGIVGSGGVGLVYNETLSHSTYNSNTLYMNKSLSYTGFGITYDVVAWVDVTTSQGYGFSVN